MEDEERARLEELFTGLEALITRLRHLDTLQAGGLDTAERERLTRLLEDVDVESKRVLSVYGKRCAFCRASPADIVGTCAKCGAEACTNCGAAYQGVVLHRGTCAAFYGGIPEA